MHGITCHAAVAFKSAAVKLSATLCAERVLSPVQQLIDAWQHTPCCIAASMSQFWPLSAGRSRLVSWPCFHGRIVRQIGHVSSGLSRPSSRLAALGWRHSHASVAAGCRARELVGSLNNASGGEDLDIVHEQRWLCVVHKLDGCE